MFRGELEKSLRKNEKIKASMDSGELNDAQFSTLIDQAYNQALPLLQRWTWGSPLLFGDKVASQKDMIEMLEGYVLSNFNRNQTVPKL